MDELEAIQAMNENIKRFKELQVALNASVEAGEKAEEATKWLAEKYEWNKCQFQS